MHLHCFLLNKKLKRELVGRSLKICISRKKFSGNYHLCNWYSAHYSMCPAVCKSPLTMCFCISFLMQMKNLLCFYQGTQIWLIWRALSERQGLLLEEVFFLLKEWECAQAHHCPDQWDWWLLVASSGQGYLADQVAPWGAGRAGRAVVLSLWVPGVQPSPVLPGSGSTMTVLLLLLVLLVWALGHVKVFVCRSEEICIPAVCF